MELPQPVRFHQLQGPQGGREGRGAHRLHVADDGPLWHVAHGLDVANGQRGLLTRVDELRHPASVSGGAVQERQREGPGAARLRLRQRPGREQWLRTWPVYMPSGAMKSSFILPYLMGFWKVTCAGGPR